jgi:hypothetical protein
MKGLIEVTATKGGKVMTDEIYGDLADKASLFARLMNRNKVLHSQRSLWRLTNIKLIKEIHDR